MSKVLVEFINACGWCDKYGAFVQKLGKEYEDKIEVKIYRAGKDFNYLKKYGMVSKSILIINEKRKIQKLSEETISNAIEEAVSEI